MRSLLLALLFFPLCVFAYTSVIADPANDKIVLPIANAEVPQEHFGKLLGFPHTFEFKVTEAMPFKAHIAVQDTLEQKNDISIIVIKQERRGVSEVGRTRIKDQAWETQKDVLLAETFRSGGRLEAQLEPGMYKLEVSSPDNVGKYKLEWGTTKLKRSYFENVRVLFEVKSFLDSSPFSAFLSPLLYIPLLLLLLIACGVLIYLKRATLEKYVLRK